MTEILRLLLESYDGIIPHIRVQTDLSASHAPSYAIAQRGRKIGGEDVLGRKSFIETFALHMRRASASENDRRGAHEFLQRLGDWLALQGDISADDRHITRIETGRSILQEAYDDGTAIWSMEIRLFTEEI